MSVEHALLVSKAAYIPKSLQFIIGRGDNFQCSEELGVSSFRIEMSRIEDCIQI
jgi:hypothetical protein